MEDSFYIIQYQVKRLCNKVKSQTDLLPLFWTSRLQLWTSRELGPTSPWTSEKNSFFHTPVNQFRIHHRYYKDKDCDLGLFSPTIRKNIKSYYPDFSVIRSV